MSTKRTVRWAVLAALLAFPMASHADDWTGKDKVLHFSLAYAATLVPIGMVGLGTDDTYLAACQQRDKFSRFWMVVVAGLCVAKEATDDRFSWKDLAWDAGGIGAGYATARLMTF